MKKRVMLILLIAVHHYIISSSEKTDIIVDEEQNVKNSPDPDFEKFLSELPNQKKPKTVRKNTISQPFSFKLFILQFFISTTAFTATAIDFVIDHPKTIPLPMPITALSFSAMSIFVSVKGILTTYQRKNKHAVIMRE